MARAASSVADLLAEAGISGLRSMEAGRSEKLLCPRCQGGRTREKSLSVTIDEDGDGARWQCHRGNCGWRDGGRVRRQDEAPRAHSAPPTRQVQPAPPVSADQQIRNPALYAWWQKRGISQETVDAFGIYLTKRRFPDPVGEAVAMVFPYLVDGVVVNRKYRPPQKTPQLQEKDALPSLFNIDAVTSDDVMAWVEGEPDVLALHEAGWPQAVSLPNGAPAQPETSDKRYAPLRTHADRLERVQKIILAGDMDEPGRMLREELARRLGRHRCWIAEWPEGCKDANDTLLQHGADAVLRALTEAQPYPIEGVQRLTGSTLARLRAQAAPPVLHTGIGALDEKLHLPSEGRLIVVTGLANHGKSTFVRAVKVALMQRHERRFAVFSPEMQPWEQYAASVAETIAGQPFRPIRGRDGHVIPAISDEDLAAIEDWLRTRCVFLVSDAEDSPPTLDQIIERASACVLRDGITDLLIDPWNELEHDRGGMTESDYIGRSLQRLKAFAFRHGCNVWIVAHPPKLAPPKPGQAIEPPTLYDISGSANWANKADIGLTVHNKDGETRVLIGKIRFPRHGQRMSHVALLYDPVTSRFTSADNTTRHADGQDDLLDG